MNTQELFGLERHGQQRRQFHILGKATRVAQRKGNWRFVTYKNHRRKRKVKISRPSTQSSETHGPSKFSEDQLDPPDDSVCKTNIDRDCYVNQECHDHLESFEINSNMETGEQDDDVQNDPTALDMVEENENTQEQIIFEDAFLKECVRGGVSHRIMDNLWKIVQLHHAQIHQRITSGTLPSSLVSYRRKLLNSLDKSILVSYTFRSIVTNELHEVANVNSISVSNFSPDLYSRVMEHVYLHPKHIIQLFKSLHESEPREVTLWTDGIRESNTRSLSLDVFALRFKGCRAIIPFSVAKSYENESFDSDSILKRIVADLNAEGLIVTHFVADAPKRKHLMRMSSFMSYYGCDVCTNMGAWFKPNPEAKGWMTWPSSTRLDFQARTKEQTLRQAEREGLPGRERLGVVGRSHLFDLKMFDPVSQLQPEAMHMAYLGVVKLMASLSLGINPKRASNLNRRKLGATEGLNKKLLMIKVPSELNRTRVLDASYKAQDYRNLAIFYFPLVCNEMEAISSVQLLWALVAFILRAYSSPEDEFKTFFRDENNVDLRTLREKWYDLFDKTFGARHCTYNCHLFLHLDRLRALGPINMENAFPFEGVLSVMKNCYAAGTLNIGKQIVLNHCLRQLLLNHTCTHKMALSSNKTAKTNNSLCYRFQDGRFKFFKLRSKISEGKWLASEISKSSFQLCGLPWNLVGVFSFHFLQPDQLIINEEDITGKAIKVGPTIMSVSRATLFEDN